MTFFLATAIFSRLSLANSSFFRFEDGSVFFTENSLEGCTKLFRLLLIRRYRTFNHDGFEAFKECEPVIYYNTPAMFVIAQYLCSNVSAGTMH